MKALLFTLVALFSLAVSTGTAMAQKKAKELQNRVNNLQTDLEVLQEFLQEQSGSLAKFKKATNNDLELLRKQVGIIDLKVGGLSDLADKNKKAILVIEKAVKQEAERITRIEEEMARKKITFSGQVRIRPELRMNQRYFNNLLDQDRNFGASHRARVGIDVAPLSFLRGRLTLQDARTWGSQTMFLQRSDLGQTSLDGTTLRPEDRNPDSALRVHEAFLDLEIADDIVALKIGRQAWNFGAGRIIGNNDWEQGARSFDGLDLTIKYKNYIRADLLFAWIDERAVDNGDDVLFGGAYLSVPYFDGLPIDAYFLYLSDPRENAKRNIGTIGLRVGGKLPAHKNLFFDLEGALQFGTVTEQRATDNNTVDNSQYAILMHADLGYELSVKTSPAIALFFDMASGDGNTSPADPTNDQAVSWIPLFPTQHGFFGRMDIWNQTNLWDFGGLLRFKPVKGLEIGAELHSLHLYADTGAIPWGGESSGSYLEALDTNLGVEFDLYADYRLNDNFGFGGGYSVFVPGATFDDLDERDPVVINDEKTGEPFRYPRGDAAHWLYLQADLTF
jgi:hypothetical protein